MPTARLDRAAWPFALALLVAAVTRLCAPFDGLFGQDAFAYFRFAKAFGPHLFHGAPLPDLYWPRGYPAAVAALLPLSGGGPLAGQLVSTLAVAWAASAAFLLVRELDRMRGGVDDPTARIVAGLSVAASGIALRTGQVVMADGLGIGLAATALWCVARHLRTGRGPWLVAGAVAVAAGAITRWQVGLLALPIGAALVIARRARGARGGWGWWAAAALAGLCVLVPQLYAAHAVPYTLERHDWLLRWSPANAFGRDFDTREAHFHYRFPVGLFCLWRLGWPDALFPTVAALALVGAWTLARQRRAAPLALLAGWVLVNTAFVCGIPYENPRFLWPALPALGALIGIGYAFLRGRLPPGLRRWLALGFAASLAAGLALGAREHGRTVARKNDDRAVVDWLDATVPAGTTLLMPGGSMMAEYYGRVPVRDTYPLTPVDLPSLLAQACPCFYLEDPAEIEGRMAGRPPQRVAQALRRDPGLTAVARRGPLTLYRVGPPR